MKVGAELEMPMTNHGDSSRQSEEIRRLEIRNEALLKENDELRFELESLTARLNRELQYSHALSLEGIPMSVEEWKAMRSDTSIHQIIDSIEQQIKEVQ